VGTFGRSLICFAAATFCLVSYLVFGDPLSVVAFVGCTLLGLRVLFS